MAVRQHTASVPVASANPILRWGFIPLSTNENSKTLGQLPLVFASW